MNEWWWALTEINTLSESNILYTMYILWIVLIIIITFTVTLFNMSFILYYYYYLHFSKPYKITLVPAHHILLHLIFIISCTIITSCSRKILNWGHEIVLESKFLNLLLWRPQEYAMATWWSHLKRLLLPYGWHSVTADTTVQFMQN